MNLHYRKAFRIPRKMAKHLLSALYPMVVIIWPLPKVLSIEETIEDILKHRKSIARFGDSEFLYIIDKLNLPYQTYDEALASKLKEILKSDLPQILVGLPSGYHGLHTQDKASRTFWRSQISWIWPRLRPFLKLNKTYANASMSRLYIELADKCQSKRLFEMVMKLWENRKILLIEGEKSRLGVGNDLLEKALSVKRILGPAHHAWKNYEKLLAEALKHDRDHLVLVAMGPTAKPIAFELAKAGYQAIDIGNLDVEYEWFRMGATEKVKIKGKYTSEASGGRIVDDLDDSTYTSQIIAKIL